MNLSTNKYIFKCTDYLQNLKYQIITFLVKETFSKSEICLGYIQSKWNNKEHCRLNL